MHGDIFRGRDPARHSETRIDVHTYVRWQARDSLRFFRWRGATQHWPRSPQALDRPAPTVVSSTFTNSNTAPQTIINGTALQPAVCYTTAPVTPPLTITVTTVTACPPATGVDQGLASANLNGQPCTFLGAGAIALDSLIVGSNPPGTIPPGCYFR